MPIELPCQQCQKTLRVPDDSAGKMAKCPNCQAINQVPVASVGGPFGPPPGSTFGTPSLSPFGPKPPADFGTSSSAQNPFAQNPYATPVMPAPGQYSGGQSYGMPISADQIAAYAKSKLMPAAILQMIGATFSLVSGLTYMGLMLTFFFTDGQQFNAGRNQQDAAFGFGMLAIGGFGNFVLGSISLAGAIAMLRQRGRGLAVAGAICAVIPTQIFANCCCVTYFFAFDRGNYGPDGPQRPLRQSCF